MEHTKKLLLVDPRAYQQHLEYRELLKSPPLKRVAEKSVELKRLLDDDRLPVDIKAKRYQNSLSKLMNISDSIPETTQIDFVAEKKTARKKTGRKKTAVSARVSPRRLRSGKVLTGRSKKKKSTPPSSEDDYFEPPELSEWLPLETSSRSRESTWPSTEQEEEWMPQWTNL